MPVPRGSLVVTLLLAWLLGANNATAHEPNPADLRCMALTLYWEAEAEGHDGMLAVAAVVFNRVEHPSFPAGICGVVQQGGEAPPCQFSWWCDGKSDNPRHAKTWQLAQGIARTVLRERPPDPTGGALFFHHTALNVPWTVKRERTAIIGRHAFYR